MDILKNGSVSELVRSASFYFLAIAAILVLYRLSRVGARPRDFPPGPPTLPFIGNIHQLPKKDLHLAYEDWAKKYGPIYSLRLGQSTVIVLANGDMIRQLVDKRGANYADRQSLYMRDLWEDSRIIMRGYDDLWKVERKLYHNFLNISISRKYYPVQEYETTQLLFDLLHKPGDFVNHITRTTSSIGSSMTYGFRLTSMDDPDIKELNRNSHGFFEMVVHSKLLDWYPSLRPLVKLIPVRLNPLARQAADYYLREKAHFLELFLNVKRKAEADSLPCFAKDIAKAQEQWKGTTNGELLTDHAASYIAGISFEGGADTSRNTLTGFVKAMALFPETQAEAQKEIDRVVGRERLPTISDFKDLPYIRCVAKEALRWMPVGATGSIPHATMHDDEIMGYRIPKGAGIVLAMWSANHDTSLFPDPRRFNPARHDPSLSLFEAGTTSDYRQRDQWSFGSGRRMCPGIHVAEKTLFIAISRILWAFTISKDRDESGKEIFIDPDAITQSLAASPQPFKCRIVPRDENRVSMIEAEWAKATELLDAHGNFKTSLYA